MQPPRKHQTHAGSWRRSASCSRAARCWTAPWRRSWRGWRRSWHASRSARVLLCACVCVCVCVCVCACFGVGVHVSLHLLGFVSCFEGLFGAGSAGQRRRTLLSPPGMQPAATATAPPTTHTHTHTHTHTYTHTHTHTGRPCAFNMQVEASEMGEALEADIKESNQAQTLQVGGRGWGVGAGGGMGVGVGGAAPCCDAQQRLARGAPAALQPHVPRRLSSCILL